MIAVQLLSEQVINKGTHCCCFILKKTVRLIELYYIKKRRFTATFSWHDKMDNAFPKYTRDDKGQLREGELMFCQMANGKLYKTEAKEARCDVTYCRNAKHNSPLVNGSTQRFDGATTCNHLYLFTSHCASLSLTHSHSTAILFCQNRYSNVVYT